MTDEQINAAITESIDADPHWKCAKDYCNDLNAMHEAQKHISQDIWNVYINKLARVTGAEESTDRIFLCATARQRAEAFLRTLGKWDQSGDATEMEVQK